MTFFALAILVAWLGPGGPEVREMNVSAYCPCSKCCGRWSDGITASGKPVTTNGGRFVAAPRSLGLGVLVAVPGYADGRPVPVLDRGGAIKGDKLDLFYPTHAEALQWGRQTLWVTVWAKVEE